MKCPLLITGAVPKFDIVLRIFRKEFCENCSRVNLIWMRERVEDLPHDMEGVSDDYNVFDVGVSNCLVNTTLDSKELSFCCGDINGPV